MAKYDLKNSYKVQCAKEYFDKLLKKEAWIELKELRLPHSIDAHRLYWLWLGVLEKEIQQDKNELHYLYRATFLSKPEDYIMKWIPEMWPRCKVLIDDFKFFPGMNVIIDIISESTSLLSQDTAQFSEYLKQVQKHARVYHNVILLNKDDQNFKDFYSEYGFC